MKSVLLSIKPNHCQRIEDGIKKIEVRVTTPKQEPPYRCLVYECKTGGRGMVIGEFICDRVEKYHADLFEYGIYDIDDDTLKDMCLNHEELYAYARGRRLTGLHISNYTKYDEPKKITDFGLKRAPQSWCYLED